MKAADRSWNDWSGVTRMPKWQEGGLCSKKQAGFIAYLSGQCGANWTFAKAAELSARQASGIIKDLKKKAGR